MPRSSRSDSRGSRASPSSAVASASSCPLSVLARLHASMRAGSKGARRMGDRSIFPGTIDWSGENPGMYLKESADRPFVTLLSFFRVVLSPHGRGHALVMIQDPQSAAGTADRPNLCLSDNEKLARWLVADYVAQFGAFKGLPALAGLGYRPLRRCRREGDARQSYAEIVEAEGFDIRLSWEGL